MLGVRKTADVKSRSTIIALLKWLQRMLNIGSRVRDGKGPSGQLAASARHDFPLSMYSNKYSDSQGERLVVSEKKLDCFRCRFKCSVKQSLDPVLICLSVNKDKKQRHNDDSFIKFGRREKRL